MLLPNLPPARLKGEEGVNLVNSIVTSSLGWIFIRNHQEHDFGIDGQIERVLDGGGVTGQLLGVQIKHGRSYLKKKNSRGFVYHGEQKHLAYLSNYPIPVIIVICDPDSKVCYWEKFEPLSIRPTKRGWKMTIPFEQKLLESKSRLETILGKLRDAEADLKDFWIQNEILASFGTTTLVIDGQMIADLDIKPVLSFIERLKLSKELAFEKRGSVELMFHGYDDDPRELYEIFEIREYCELLNREFREKFFFLRTAQPCWSLRLLLLCNSEIFDISKINPEDSKLKIELNSQDVGNFLQQNFPGLNEMTEWLSMSEEENKAITFAVFDELGVSDLKN